MSNLVILFIWEHLLAADSAADHRAEAFWDESVLKTEQRHEWEPRIAGSNG